MRARLSKHRIKLAGTFAALVFAVYAPGQEVGHYLQGAAGLSGGSLAPPGFYLGFSPYYDVVTSVVGPNGGSIGGRNHLTVAAYMAAMSAVTKTKFLGADFGFAIIVPVTKQRLTSDLLPSQGFGTYGMSDYAFSPIELGWHKPKADILFSYSFYVPTGDFSSDKFFNTGLGMWTNQFQLGTTYYPDKLKKWNVSLLSTWEINGTKTGTNVKPGPGMTLEYGLGKRLFRYKVNVGVAGSYYRKLALDSGTAVAFYDQENSIGPEFSFTLPSAHLAFDVRYEPQFEVRGRTSGQLLSITLSYLSFFEH